MRSCALWLCGFWMTQSLVWAQGGAASEARLGALEEQVRILQAQVQSLQALLASSSSPVASQTAGAGQPVVSMPAAGSASQVATPTLPVYGGATAASKVFNPDIAVIGNFIGGIGRNPENPFPSLALRESELSFQAIIDPYARGDFFVSIGSKGAEIEEGYITFPALPGGFSLRAGRMRSAFGKMNSVHNHVLPWLDRPLVTYNLLGGDPSETDAGIKDDGLSISRILPSPRGLFLEAVAEVYAGNSGSLFQASRHSDVSTIEHLRAYHDFTESTNLEVGGSYGRGHNAQGSNFTTQLFGADATLRWKPLRRSIYRSFNARTEVDWSRREQPGATLWAHGFFASAEYQLARRWFAGARMDWSERAQQPGSHDSGESAILTFWPSEFSQIRGQFRRTNYAQGIVANELLLQFQYSLGAHGAHPF
jgi:hypothetical protein